jgi:uncharacterized protein YhhL (DUF1145 family)
MNKITFKDWAFRFTIWILVINIITFYLTINYVNFPGAENNTGLIIYYLGIISLVLLLLSIAFIAISSVKKEKKNYKYWVSIIGIILFGVLPLLSNYM